MPGLGVFSPLERLDQEGLELLRELEVDACVPGTLPPPASEITTTARQSGFIHPYCQPPPIGTGDPASLLTCGDRAGLWNQRLGGLGKGLSPGGNKSRQTHRYCSESRCRCRGRSAAVSGALGRRELHESQGPPTQYCPARAICHFTQLTPTYLPSAHRAQ